MSAFLLLSSSENVQMSWHKLIILALYVANGSCSTKANLFSQAKQRLFSFVFIPCCKAENVFIRVSSFALFRGFLISEYSLFCLNGAHFHFQLHLSFLKPSKQTQIIYVYFSIHSIQAPMQSNLRLFSFQFFHDTD